LKLWEDKILKDNSLKKSTDLDNQKSVRKDSKFKSWIKSKVLRENRVTKIAFIFNRLGFYTVLATIFLVPLAFSNQTFDILELPKQALLGVLVVLSFFLWLAKSVLSAQFKFKKSSLNIAVVVFLISSAISTVGSTSPVTSFLGFYARGNDSFLVIILLTLFFFVAVNSIESQNDLKKMAGTFLFSIGLVIFHAFFQVLGIFVLPFEITKSKVFNTAGSINVLAAILAIALLFSVALIINSKIKSKISVGILGTLSFILLLGLNINYIWYGLMAGLIAMVAVTIASKKEIDYKLLAIPAFVLLISFVMLSSTSFGLKIPKGAQLNRTTAKSIVTSTITGKLLFGSGPETFIFDYAKFRPRDVNEKLTESLRFDKAHNEYFQMTATRGLLGLFVYLLLFVVLIVLAGTYVLKTEDAFGKSLAVGILSSSVFLAVHSYYYFNNTTLIFIIFVLLSLTAGLKSLEKEAANKVSVNTLEAKAFSVILLLFALFGVIGVTYTGSRAYAADAVYKNGIGKSSSAKTIKSAKNDFDKAVKLNPYREPYYLNVARANLILANQEGAKKKNERNEGIIRNKVAVAIASGQAAINLNPVNVANWASMAVIYRNVGLYASNALPWIEKSYVKAVELEPNNAYLHNSLGQVYLTTKEYDKAIAMFDKAIELKKDLADSHFNLGLVHIQKQDYAKAKQYFNKVLKFKPGSKDTKKVLEDIKKLENGTAVLQKSGEILDGRPPAGKQGIQGKK
ncbi:hypothetical protein LCGC14_1271000, partial [marine sediment metagenome]